MPEPSPPHPTVNISRLQHAADAEAMRTVYNNEVENFTTTLDMVPRSLTDQQTWIAARSGAFAAIVAEVDDHVSANDGLVVGFASLSPFKGPAPPYSSPP